LVRMVPRYQMYKNHEILRKSLSDGPTLSHRRSNNNKSTSKSMSISRVKMEVGEEKHQSSRKLAKKFKSRKSFLEKLYTKIKQFARVTLASRKEKNDDKEIDLNKHSFGHNNSENGSQERINLAPSEPNTSANVTNHQPPPSKLQTNFTSEPTTEPHGPSVTNINSDYVKNNDNSYRKWFDRRQNSSNAMSFNDFFDSPIIHVETHDVSNDISDIETPNKAAATVIVDALKDEPRSQEARGRSLWMNDHLRVGQKRTVVFESDSINAESRLAEKFGLLEWSNVIIVAVSISAAIAFITVLVVAVVYRRVRIRQESCDQFSDVTSTSSRSSASTCSTISSTRSTKSVPDRMNIISFNAEGNLRKQAYNCDDLYSLDSDYFLSSLEDISVQM